jgi:phospholipid/cholesterol/gamma-HCH transport system permease protein
MQDVVELWEDVGKGMVKSVLFGIVVTWIAVYQGYDTEPTAEGIGLSTTRTVVLSSVMILAMDFLLTLSMYGDFR